MKRRYTRIAALISLLVTFSFALSATLRAEEGPAPITALDGLGRTVCVPGPAKRIVTNYGIAVDMIFTLDAEDTLVGVDTGSPKNSFLKALYPRIGRIENVGTVSEVNREQILALRPDLVVLPGKNAGLVSRIEGLGIPVFGVNAEDLDKIRDCMVNLGRLLGKERAAERFCSYYDKTVHAVRAGTATIMEKDRPAVYLAGPMGVLSTCSKDMYQNHLIHLCGGRNLGARLTGALSGHGWVEVSAEDLIGWDPDLILIVRYSGLKIETILGDVRWRGLRAVAERRVFFFPSNLNSWDYPSPQSVLGIRWLARKLHPRRFTHWSVMQEADRFFREFYGRGFRELGGEVD